MSKSFKESLIYSRDKNYTCLHCGSPADDIVDDYDYEENYTGSFTTCAITPEHAVLMEEIIEAARELASSNGSAFIHLNNVFVALDEYRRSNVDYE